MKGKHKMEGSKIRDVFEFKMIENLHGQADYSHKKEIPAQETSPDEWARGRSSVYKFPISY